MRDLNEIQIFALVAREMSFTRAAQALEISKAAVSRAIASLENRLAARLFERTTRRLRLTEAGEIFVSYANRATEEAADGEMAVAKLTQQPRGILRVILPVTLAQSSVAPKLAKFLRAYPELRIEMMLRGGQIDPIQERVDVAFQVTRPELDSRLIQKRMQVVPVGLYASKQYLASAPPLRQPQDLIQHSCLTLTMIREGAIWNLRKGGKVQDIRLPGRAAVFDPVVRQQLCRDGAGIATLPEWLVREDVSKKRLSRVLPDWTLNPVEIYAVYPTRLSMTPKLNAFLRFMETVLA